LKSRLQGQQQQQQQGAGVGVGGGTPAEQQAGRGTKRAKTLLQQHLEQQAQQQQQSVQEEVQAGLQEQEQEQQQRRVEVAGAPDYAALLAMQPAPADEQQQDEDEEKEQEGAPDCVAEGFNGNRGAASGPEGSDRPHGIPPAAPSGTSPAAAAQQKPQRRQKQAASNRRCSTGAAQSPAAAELPFPGRLLEVDQVGRKEGAALLALQVPGVLEELLGSFSRLNLAYAVLLQQRVLPRWAALRSACKVCRGC
jgi:hypothetical protein